MTRCWKKNFTGFCFTNLVDFDTMYGHRRDPKGFGQALMEFDQRLGHVLAALRPDDLLLITADHGNDPCFKGTDHTREEVPLLAWSPKMQASGSSVFVQRMPISALRSWITLVCMH